MVLRRERRSFDSFEKSSLLRFFFGIERELTSDVPQGEKAFRIAVRSLKPSFARMIDAV
jgi:hypothetical protein